MTKLKKQSIVPAKLKSVGFSWRVPDEDIFFSVKKFEVHSLQNETKVENLMLVLAYTQKCTYLGLLRHEMMSQDTCDQSRLL